MAPKPLLLCLLFASACSAPPAAPRDPEDERRSAWREKVRPIRPHWTQKELEEFLDSIVPPAPHRPGLQYGGGFPLLMGPVPRSQVYTLDESFALYVVWGQSAEVVGLSDLRRRIDPELFDAVSAVHRSPTGQGGFNFDPVALIRAVNALQPLGKEKALKALRAYRTLAAGMTPVETKKYAVDETRILPIVQLLFENPGGKMPDFALGIPDVESPGPELWPLYPMALVQDVPFMLVSGYMFFGSPSDVGARLELPLGPLRASPLAPRVTPLEAADELTESGAWKALPLQPGQRGSKRWQVRRQALAAAGTVFAVRPEETTTDCCVDPTEAQWRTTVQRAQSSGILWSPEIQDFILGR